MKKNPDLQLITPECHSPEMRELILKGLSHAQNHPSKIIGFALVTIHEDNQSAAAWGSNSDRIMACDLPNMVASRLANAMNTFRFKV